MRPTAPQPTRAGTPQPPLPAPIKRIEALEDGIKSSSNHEERITELETEVKNQGASMVTGESALLALTKRMEELETEVKNQGASMVPNAS